MRNIATIILLAALLFVLCACGTDSAADPLPFISPKDDGLFMTDRGRLQVKDGVVTAANITVSRNGFPDDLVLGNMKREARSAATTQMTVGQFRAMVDVLIAQLPELLKTSSYRVILWPTNMQQGGDAFPCWTYSLSSRMLSEGTSAAADQGSFGRLSISNGTLLAHIFIEP